MSCTSNTLVRNYDCIKGSNLIISGKLLSGGVAMNLAGYEFKMEICENDDFLDTTITDKIATIASNEYTFNLATSSWAVKEYHYRVTMKDSLGNIFPQAIRAGRINLSE